MNYWWEGGLVFFHFVFHSVFFYSQVYCSTCAKIEKKLLTLLFTTLSFSRLSSEYQYDLFFKVHVFSNQKWLLNINEQTPNNYQVIYIYLYCKTCLIRRGLVLKIFTWYDNIRFVGHCCILISDWLTFYINNHIHNITT